jgi:menaquinone-9 beta-reductase
VSDIVVVGAGPAGSATALLLARAGHPVTLVDRARFPRRKACGECLNPGAVATLRRLGLADRIEALRPATLTGWDLIAPSGRTYHASFPADAGVAWGLDRGALDWTLLRAAREAGARVMEGTRVVGVRSNAGAPSLTLANGGSLCPRLVVGADGLRSVVARATGAATRGGMRKASLSIHVTGIRDLTPDRGRLAFGGPVTLGLAPLDPEGRRWTLTVVVPSAHASELPRDGGRLVRFAAARLPALAGAEAIGPPLGSGPFDWPTAPLVQDGILLVGDAAGYYDPLTGQGLYRALRAAELAAPVVARALRDGRTSSRALGSYASSVRAAFRGGRRLQRAVETLRRRPRLLSAGLALADRGQGLDTLIAVLGDARPVRSLLRPSFLVGFLVGLSSP